MVHDIKMAVQNAATKNQKIAMFHFQVLKHAKELEGMDAEAFCDEISVPATYQTEFRKMISLARLMDEMGVRLVG